MPGGDLAEEISMPPRPYTLTVLNRLGDDQFISALTPLFEGPPWIIAAAISRRPFASLDDLLATCVDILRSASEEAKLALLRAHPDLVGRAALAGTLSPASQGEQAAAGLDALTADDIVTFQHLNAEYQGHFGFPFIICAREHKKESILQGFETRRRHDRATEIAIALDEVLKICALRLRDLMRPEEGSSSRA
jgi:OHCU decarboxylase